MAAASVAVWYGLMMMEAAQIERTVQVQAVSVTNEIEARLESRIMALVRMGRRWEMRGQPPRTEWESDAGLYVAHYEGYEAIVWVDPSFEVRWRVATTAALAVTAPAPASWRPALARARDHRAATLARMAASAHDQATLVITVPIFGEQAFGGWIVGVFRVQALLEAILGKHIAPGYGVALFEGASPVFRREPGVPADDERWGQEARLTLRALAWGAWVWPGGEVLALARSPLPGAVLAGGLLMAVVLAVTVYLAQMARRRASEIDAVNRVLISEISERRQAEDTLRKLSRAVEQSPSSVIITDTDGEIEYVNPKFTQLTGYTLDEVRGKNPRLLKSGETDPVEYRRLWRTITAGGEWRGIFHNKKKSGELYWEATCISPVRDADGQITHFLAVKEDITERMQLEERFRRVVESTPSGLLMVNQQGRIVLVNSQTERLFGYCRDELIGQPVEMLVPRRFRSRHPQQRNGFFLEGEARAMGAGRDLCGLHKDGTEFPVEIGLSPIETQEGKLVLGAIVDVTERKRLEKQLEERNREIARTQALAAMGRMASMVAHDLRNPLSCIKMSLQMLGAQSSDDWQEAEHELKQIALEQVRYMEVLMADLLVYSRPDALKPEWLNIDKLLDTAVILAQKYIDEHKVRVKSFYQAGLPTVHGDVDKLRRAFSNLIVNAAQATEGVTERAAQVTISTRLELGEDRPRVRVEICDNGRGVEEGSEEMVFEPFFTTRAKGTGLGLAIVKRIVEQHQGSVRLQPAGTHGTCAVVILPTGPVTDAGRRGVEVGTRGEPAPLMSLSGIGEIPRPQAK